MWIRQYFESIAVAHQRYLFSADLRLSHLKDPHVTESRGATTKPTNTSWALPDGAPRDALVTAPRAGVTAAGGAMPARAGDHIVTFLPHPDDTQPDTGRSRSRAADEEAERECGAIHPQGENASIDSAGVEHDDCGGRGEESPRHVSSRSPSATIWGVLQLLLIATLSLVEYVAVEASWLSGVVTSIR